MRLPSSTATRSPRLQAELSESRRDLRGLLRDFAPGHPRVAADQRLAVRISSQRRRATIAQMLSGRSQKAGTTRSPKRASSRIGGNGVLRPVHRLASPLSALLHAVDMFGPGKRAGAHVAGIALDRGFDRGAEIAVAADEFRRPRRQAQHVLQHQHLAVAGRTGADADGGNGDGLA